MRGKPDRAQFSAASAAGALASACAETGLDPTEARLLRLGENAIYALPREGVVARIARSTALADRVLREVRIADWLAERDYPAVRTAADVKQAIEAEGRLVTFWQLVPPNTMEDECERLAALQADVVRQVLATHYSQARDAASPSPAGLPKVDLQTRPHHRAAEAAPPRARVLRRTARLELASLTPNARSCKPLQTRLDKPSANLSAQPRCTTPQI